jgi:branched-chain amino acid transport system substrate-binding protein
MGKHLADAGRNKVYVMAPNYQAGKDTLAGFQRTYKKPLGGESLTKFGELEFSSELSTLRAAKPDAAFVFYPGAMGVSYLKQYGQAGLRTSIPLYVIWTLDQSNLPAIGDDALGVLSVSMWSVDLDNAENRRFVGDYEKKSNGLPNDYAALAYDTLQLIGSAVRQVKGDVGNKEQFRKALRSAEFKSVRGTFAFGKNGFPIQDYYLREVAKRNDGVLITKTLGKVMSGAPDAYAHECEQK